MEQGTATKHREEPSPLDTTGLCLLSLDGGGVRGLSSLYILKGLMDRLNQDRKNLQPLKPCEVFDLIGGTSTGGLIAIMLGRLEMDVDECIAAYTRLMKTVFETKRSRFAASLSGKIKARFDSAKLETAIKEVVTSRGAKETDLLNDGVERRCRVFVCTIAHETKDVVRLRSYDSGKLPIRATIVQAALATSAATTFFDSVTIGSRKFVDGGLRVNNPVEEVEGEASDIWCSNTGDLKPLVKCFVSIGTGNPGKKAIEDNVLKFLSGTLAGLATQTENTEKNFVAKWRQQLEEKRYFRFNVDHGLQDVGLAEYLEQGAIEAATYGYLDYQGQEFRVRDCVHNLKLKQSRATTNLSYIVSEFNMERIVEFRTNTQVGALWNVPFQRNARFVGRTLEITQINDLLANQSRCERVALTGLGGVGKTQVALEFAHQWRERYSDCTVFWVPVMNVESMLKAYQGICQQLQIPAVDQKADVQQLVHQRLSQESSVKWLLVFDNADDIDIWMENVDSSAGSYRRIDSLPKSKHGSILFTTRSRKAATKLAEKNIVSVGQMDDAMAKGLLEKSLIDRNLVKDDQATTAKLLLKLTHLPLAIVQAAAYMNENLIGLTEYAALLDDTEQNIVSVLSEEFEDEGRYGDIKNPIATTWLISFKQIWTRYPLAAEYLSFMSCIDAKDIPQSLLPPAQSAKKAVDAIGTLSAYSFITKHEENQLMDLHRLVHLAMRNWLRTESSLEQWTVKALERLEEVFPDSDHENRSIWRSYLPHARYALESSSKQGLGEKEMELKKMELLWKVGNCTYSDGRYKEAEEDYKTVMETRSRAFGEEHPDTLDSMASLASTYRKQGRWKEAEELEVQVIETRKRVLQPEHPDTLSSMANLAKTYSSQGRWKEAEDIGAQITEMRKRVLGQEHPDTLDSMADLMWTYFGQGQLKKAEHLGVEVMEKSKRILGPEHEGTLEIMANLAWTYLTLAQWKQAEELGLQVVETRKKVLGLQHPDTLESISDLAVTYLDEGRTQEAEELSFQVLKIRESVLGQEHPDTLISRNNLAITYLDLGQWKKAEQLLVEVIETSKKIIGHEHPDTLNAMSNLVWAYINQERWKMAEELGVQVLETRKSVLGLEHPDTLRSMAHLGWTFSRQERWKEAEELELQVIETRKRILGRQHMDTLAGMSDLVAMYWDQGRTKEAKALHEQVMELRDGVPREKAVWYSKVARTFGRAQKGIMQRRA